MLPKAWSQITPYLAFNCCVFLLGAIIFGIDTGSFGGLQALPSFLNDFGVPGQDGVYAMPQLRRSLMNSLPWIGKILGCFSSDILIERLGFKNTMLVAAGVQIVGVILEITAHHWMQFTIGRDVAYFAVGLVENAVPSYNAETSPAATRGLLSGSIMFVTALGNLWGAGMSRAFATEPSSKGWMIPTGMQFIPAILLLVFIPFTPESPRWLLAKGRFDDAKRSLDKIRHKYEVEDGSTAAELNAMNELVQESLATEEGGWLDLFRGNYLRRTWIAGTLFAIQQSNGNQFVQSYAATFYVQQGLGAMSFTYNMIGQSMGILGCLVGVILFDITGRRPLLIYGSVVCTFLLFLASGIGGSTSNPSQQITHTMISCFMIFPAFTRIAATNTAFLTGAEIGGVRMRKKIMAFGLSVDVAAAFLVTFVTPYVLPILGVNIGWIFGSVCAFTVVWGWFFFPELKNRSLEEVDELFRANLKAWQFKDHTTYGTAATLTAIQNGDRGAVERANAEEKVSPFPK
ncbi:general substrate transporter [Emericellopsis atlantica]|uniref:General substrate transporter n=1 Tax=Emericellopsis atlantica TaxID=2614577 RepID=A0A9P8CMR5_9HYPO|nr:general substrate transporter [Emericellopsis atlantica]KAG9250966.1 general substrate transporter [Emericellopsis atlantica]